MRLSSGALFAMLLPFILAAGAIVMVNTEDDPNPPPARQVWALSPASQEIVARAMEMAQKKRQETCFELTDEGWYCIRFSLAKPTSRDRTTFP